MEMVFYDVTNYYFETDYDDGYDENDKPKGLRYVGVSKENRETPIVQMGLLMDKQGIPIAYKLFQGNTHDQKTLIPILEEFKQTFNLKSITVIADKGLNSGVNIDYLLKNNHKFIVSQMVRTRDEKFRTKILEQEGYNGANLDVYKLKEFTWERPYRELGTGKVLNSHKFRVIAY
jgi:transposase